MTLSTIIAVIGGIVTAACAIAGAIAGIKARRAEERRQEERIMWAMRERLAREAGETLHELEDAERERLPKGTNAEDARRAREEYVRKLEAKTPEAPEVLHELAEAEREEFAGEYDHPRSTKQEIRAAILRAEEGREAAREIDESEARAMDAPELEDGGLPPADEVL